MPKKPETVFAERVDKELKLIGGWWVNIQLVARRGIPDRIGCIGGRFISLEFKRAAGIEPTPLQVYEMQQIADNGGISLLVNPDNWKQIKKFLIKLAESKG